jgi:acylglycerol lipase
MFTYHTNIRDITYQDTDLKATMAIIHGYGENSDIFIESAIQFALNGFDVHLIDLRGFGMTGGSRMAGWKISELHYDVAALIK